MFEICKDINNPGSRSKVYWDKVKLLRKGLKPKISSEKMMKKSDGSKCVNVEENAKVFRAHFQKLYRLEPIYDPAVIELIERQPVFEGGDHNPTDMRL